MDRYRNRHRGWNVKHYYAWYKRDGGQRSYSWVKHTLQAAGAVKKAPNRGVHRKQRDRSAWPGMMLHQDGSQHLWAVGQPLLDYAGRWREGRQTQFGRAIGQLGMAMIPAYSPEARGRSERVFSTH